MESTVMPTTGRLDRGGPKRGRITIVLAIAWVATGCSLDGLLKSDKLPPDVTDPAITQTSEGAMAAYRGTLVLFRTAFGAQNINPLASVGFIGPQATFVTMGGRLSDELQAGNLTGDLVDARSMAGAANNTTIEQAYSVLQRVRGQASQAIGLLARYVPEQPALLGQTYALTGYTEVFLAELFCSGIPLSTLDFDGDYTYRSGSTTTEVFTHAIALFDTALAISGDSARFLSLAQIGKARALLALGQYAAAGTAVASVPDSYNYTINFSASDAPNFVSGLGGNTLWKFSVADHEGFNGLDYRSSGDPRTQFTTQTGTGTQAGKIVYLPKKYATDGSSPVVLASGLEARLIQAEAALQAGDPNWLTILNALRTDGTYDTTATSPPDTLWHAGMGGVAGLAPLTDPGTADGRVDLVFHERAFWLFLTGHRQGDLRRLVREYGRNPDQVYPVGSYPTGGLYGIDVVVPIPADEEVLNPYFTGCASTGA